MNEIQKTPLPDCPITIITKTLRYYLLDTMSNTVMLPIMDTETLELPQNKANDKRERKPWLFTPEQAKAFAAKSHAARKAKKIQEQAKLVELERQAERGRNIIVADAMSKSEPVALEPDEVYRLKSLKRVREQVEMLEAKLDECEEPRDLKAIADAIARLRDCEQNLAGRPSPGSRRPGREKPTKTDASGTAPID